MNYTLMSSYSVYRRYVDITNLILLYSNMDKISYMLGSEIWEEDFAALLNLVKVHRRCVGGKKKYSMVMTPPALVNFSLSPRLEIWGLSLGLGGSGLINI